MDSNSTDMRISVPVNLTKFTKEFFMIQRHATRARMLVVLLLSSCAHSYEAHGASLQQDNSRNMLVDEHASELVELPATFPRSLGPSPRGVDHEARAADALRIVSERGARGLLWQDGSTLFLTDKRSGTRCVHGCTTNPIRGLDRVLLSEGMAPELAEERASQRRRVRRQRAAGIAVIVGIVSAIAAGAFVKWRRSPSDPPDWDRPCLSIYC